MKKFIDRLRFVTDRLRPTIDDDLRVICRIMFYIVVAMFTLITVGMIAGPIFGLYAVVGSVMAAIAFLGFCTKGRRW